MHSIFSSRPSPSLCRTDVAAGSSVLAPGEEGEKRFENNEYGISGVLYGFCGGMTLGVVRVAESDGLKPMAIGSRGPTPTTSCHISLRWGGTMLPFQSIVPSGANTDGQWFKKKILSRVSAQGGRDSVSVCRRSLQPTCCVRRTTPRTWSSTTCMPQKPCATSARGLRLWPWRSPVRSRA